MTNIVTTGSGKKIRQIVAQDVNKSATSTTRWFPQQNFEFLPGKKITLGLLTAHCKSIAQENSFVFEDDEHTIRFLTQNTVTIPGGSSTAQLKMRNITTVLEDNGEGTVSVAGLGTAPFALGSLVRVVIASADPVTTTAGHIGDGTQRRSVIEHAVTVWGAECDEELLKGNTPAILSRFSFEGRDFESRSPVVWRLIDQIKLSLLEDASLTTDVKAQAVTKR